MYFYLPSLYARIVFSEGGSFPKNFNIFEILWFFIFLTIKTIELYI